MKPKNTITLLTVSIAAIATIAAATGIFSNQGPGPQQYKTLRGETAPILSVVLGVLLIL
ncbi:hypothetical protein [Telluribacter sp.]|uniref:hypothetical protein n=1 Tax=Telluribacter sp. TaxID=1978767 RepID=UPI002E0E8982|nr:hypothetical protein [Telluribacter sp.]